MTLKKLRIKNILLLALLTINTHLMGQELGTNVFFCHENMEIKALWPLGNEQFIANIKYLTTNKFTGDNFYTSNMYLLFDKSHIVTDTAYVQGSSKSFSILNENQILISSKYTSQIFNISSGKFELISKEKTHREPTLKNEYSLGSVAGLPIGYTSKAKNRTLKRSKKNIPRYFYLDKDGEHVFINSGKEEVVGDQWASFLNRFPFALGDVSQYGNELYFNIPMIGRCYVLNIKTKKIKTILLPQEGAKSWFLTVDKITGSYYLIGAQKDNMFDIHHIDLQSNKKTFLTKVEGYMDVISNDKVVYRKTISEDEKEFSCYYYKSVYSGK